MIQANYDTQDLSRVLIVGVQTPSNASKNIDSYFEEFRNLVASNGVHYDEEQYIKLRSIDPGYFFTKGKLQELMQICDDKNIAEVIISEPISNQQHRNLGKALHARIYDRTELILEIFHKGAQSSEGKLQVSIALLRHKKSRVVGSGIELSQQAGFVGGRGPGETQKEKETRHFDHLIHTLENNIKNLEKVRDTQRKSRLNRGIKQLALIGYTNSGKSTILNALTKSNVLAEDKLFATLDTTTRELFIESKKIGVISDTVGFIQQLPTKLIAAFKSTLTELAYADLLLQVIDISDKNWPEHINVVHEILEDLGVNQPMLYVFNKVDKLTPEEAALIESHTSKYRPYVLVSALSKEGLEPLRDFVVEWHKAQQPEKIETESK